MKQLQDVISDHEKNLQANAALIKKHEEIESDLRGVVKDLERKTPCQHKSASLVSQEDFSAFVAKATALRYFLPAFNEH